MAYNFNWAMRDAEKLALLWADQGDIVHPDGASERGRQTIQTNRTDWFMRKEYRDAKHILTFGQVRCLTADTAVVDGKWELRGLTDQSGRQAPVGTGLLTITLKRGDGPWRFEAYRYTMNQTVAVAPTLLKKPGYPEIIK